jgi:hypothetical protein
MRTMRLLPASALLAALGCSGETVPEPANLSGTWAFTFNTAAESGATCTGAMNFTISQTGQTFVGFQRGAGSVSCNGLAVALVAPNPSDSTEFDNEMIGTGVVGQQDVTFTLNTLNGTNNGKVEAGGRQMSGTSSWMLPVVPHGTVRTIGTFTAVKQ